MKKTLFISLCLLLAACGGGDPDPSPDKPTPGPNPNPGGDEPTEATLTLSEQRLEADPGGEVLRVTVTSSGGWSLSGTCDWAEPSSRKGTGNATVSFKIAANDTDNTRQAVYTFESDAGAPPATLRIYQSPLIPAIEVSSKSLSIPAKGGSVTFRVTSNVDYDVVISDYAQEWLTLESTGPRPEQLIFRAEANTTNKRSANITLEVKGRYIQSIEVSQPVVEDLAELIPDPNFRIFCYNTLDRDNDGKVSAWEFSYVKKMDCSSAKIVSLEGIAFFRNLSALDCSNNPLEGKLDLRQNTSLKTLTCKKISSLETILLPPDNKIQTLHLINSRFRTFDFSGCPLLTELNCAYAGLSKLDLTHNPQLATLCIVGNALSELRLGSARITKSYPDFNDDGYDEDYATGYLCAAMYRNAPSLTISGSEITSFYINTTTLYDSQIKRTIDISDCPKLRTLTIWGDPAAKMDLVLRRSQKGEVSVGGQLPKITYRYID